MSAVLIHRPSHLPLVTISKADAGGIGGGGGESGGNGGEGGTGGGSGGAGGAITQHKHAYDDEQLPRYPSLFIHSPLRSCSQNGGRLVDVFAELICTAVDGTVVGS